MQVEKYNCLIVDDEPIARRIVMGYIEQMSLLQTAGECINALSAIDHLRTHGNTDIIFLDINLPNLSGLQLMKILQPKQPVIFTTAYSEFAVESYELNAVDYLLKPFSFERFTRAIYKAISVISHAHKKNKEPGIERKQLFIKSDGKNYPVYLEDILYCEAMKNYTMVQLNGGQKLIPLIPLSKFDSLLSEAGGSFIQIHRSFIISTRHITSISSNHVTIKKFEIPLGIQFKERFLKLIGMKDNE